MNLDLRHFEQVFKPAALRKGLSFLQKDQVNSIAGEKAARSRFESAGATLWLKRNGNNITSASCSCGRPYCEHLAAVLFFLQKPKWQALYGLNGNGEQKLPARSRIKKDHSAFFSARQELTSLIKMADFSTEQGIEVMELALEKWLAKGSLRPWPFVAHLALLALHSQVMAMRFAHGSQKLNHLFEQSYSYLAKEFMRAMNDVKFALWEEAVFYVTKSNFTYSQYTVTCLLGRYLVLCSDRDKVEDLFRQMELRKKRFHVSESIDHNLLSRLQIKFRLAQLEHLAIKDPGIYGAEWILAECSLLYYGGKNKKALHLLKKARLNIKNNHPGQYLDFLSQMIQLSEKCGDKETEISCLVEKILASFVIQLTDLEKLLKLVPRKDHNKLYDDLLKQLSESNTPYGQEKIAYLMVYANRVADLVSLLIRQKTRFQLLQDLALKLWPIVPDNFLMLYSKNLSAALADASDPLRRERIMQTANKYLDQLPASYKKMVLDNVRKKALY